MNEIEPGLYLGGFVCCPHTRVFGLTTVHSVRDMQKVNSVLDAGITHILSVLLHFVATPDELQNLNRWFLRLDDENDEVGYHSKNFTEND